MKAINRDQFTDLLKQARIKGRLARELRFVPEEISQWEVRDFLAVTNRSHTEGVLIFTWQCQSSRSIWFALANGQ